MSLRRILNLAVTVICFGILLSVTIYVIVNWQDMPDQLPTNYNMRGKSGCFQQRRH